MESKILLVFLLPPLQKKIIQYIRKKPAWGKKEQMNFIKVSQPEKVCSTFLRLQL
jgi:hypothetical protein